MSKVSRSSDSSTSFEIQEDVEDLGCYPNSQSTEKNVYQTGHDVEVDVLKTAEIKAIINISGSITCLWVFKQAQTLCNHSLNSERRHVVSKEFPKLTETQAGEHMLLIRTESNNSFMVTFRLNVKRSPRKPYFAFVRTEKSSMLSCVSDGYPKPVLHWRYCEMSRSRCSNIIADTKESGDIYGTQKAQVDLTKSPFLYEPHVLCCASNDLDSVCSELHTIDLSETSENPLQEFFRKVGDPLLLRCRAAKNQNFELDWYLKHKILNESMSVDGRDFENGFWKKIKYAFTSSVGQEGSEKYICSSTLLEKKTALVTVLNKGFINITESKDIFEVGIKEKICLEIKLKAYPSIRCIWMFSQMSFPCQPVYMDDYSISSTFCDHRNQSGEYVFYAENGDTSVERRLKLYVKREPKVRIQWTPDQIFCISESSPAASLVWKKCFEENINCTEITDGISNVTHEEKNFGLWITNSILYTPEAHTAFVVVCCAKNSVASTCKTYQRSSKVAVFVQADNVALYATIGFCLPFITALFILICHNYKKQFRYESQLQMIQMVGSSDNEYIYVDFRDAVYELKWEFPRENLEFGQVLGSGAFGKVVNATAYGINETEVSVQVAVKMLKEKYGSSEKDALMSELKMMTHIGSHENIVNLLGACTTSGPIYLIFEYCCYGDLLNYLRSKRERFHKTWTDVFKQHNFSFYHNFSGHPNSRNAKILKNGSYIPMHRVNDFGNMYAKQDLDLAFKPCRTDLLSEEDEMNYVNSRMDDEEDFNVLTFEDLLCFSFQVAKGMEFLESKSCVHRDLAARNVLVTHGKVAKICDFGLARDIMNDSNYVVRGSARLPVKWMSPESLFEGIYTIKSDVWSYGILLWEIFSLGVNPYPGMQVDADFYKLIQNGFKMDQPFYATEEIYFLLCSCWALDSRKRPSFSQLLSLLACQLADAERAASQIMMTDLSRHASISKRSPHEIREAE